MPERTGVMTGAEGDRVEADRVYGQCGQCICGFGSDCCSSSGSSGSGRDYYECMVGAVMTNQYFTAPAVEAARKLKILLWDRGYLDEMMEE